MKVTEYIRNKSFRWKIMVSIVTAVCIMSLSLFITLHLDNYILSVIGSSYKSNSELGTFSRNLAECELAMENYYNYHTFESIDMYFGASNKVRTFAEEMQSFPSADEVKQKEYVVAQITLSFLEFSGKTISLRRANSSDNSYYKKSFDCYNILLQEISELNSLLLKRNAAVYDTDKKNISFILKSFFIFFIILFAFILVVLNFLIVSITKPLSEISLTALKIAQRDFDIPLFNRTTHDEIGNICSAFDRMIISIREYIKTIWEKARTENELREKEMQMHSLYADAQLKAFQSQINPHFLFNTLNTGAQLAMMEGADKTCYFIEQISDFFRYNIQQQNKEATISDELGLVDNYVYIMKVRFGKRLEFTKSVDGVDLSKRIPSMILQPIIENCIKHGLQNNTCTVKLEATNRDNYIEICISDNGGGFDEQVKKRIYEAVDNGIETIIDNKNNSEHTGIGLINVFSRLRLFYHRDNVFEIADNENTGTKFIIRVYE